MKNIGKPKYGIINNGVFGVNIISGIVTGIRFTEGKPLYEISFGKNKWWTEELCETPTDIFKALKLAPLNRVKESHGLQIKYSSNQKGLPIISNERPKKKMKIGEAMRKRN